MNTIQMVLLLLLLPLLRLCVSSNSTKPFNTTTSTVPLTPYAATSSITTSNPTVSPTPNCVEILIKDDINENAYPYPHTRNTVYLFQNWRFVLESENSYIYGEDGTRANLYYLDQTGWIIQIFDHNYTISNRVTYQSFIFDSHLPFNEWHSWIPHGNKYSTVSLYMECFETYSVTEYNGKSDNTESGISMVSTQPTKPAFPHTVLLSILATVIGLLIIVVILVFVFLYYIRSQTTLDENSENGADVIDLRPPGGYSTVTTAYNTAPAAYNTVHEALNQSEENIEVMQHIHGLITTRPDVRRVLSEAIPLEVRITMPDENSGSEQSMERTSFIE